MATTTCHTPVVGRWAALAKRTGWDCGGGGGEEGGPRVLVVDAEIGAGKTTLIRKLAAALRTLLGANVRVAVADEPVAQWEASGALRAFYDDPGRNTLPFEIYSC